jgi:hypothetical protein
VHRLFFGHGRPPNLAPGARSFDSLRSRSHDTGDEGTKDADCHASDTVTGSQ